MTVEDVRLVVWDLDETFWKGTVTEGGIQEYVQAHHDIVIELARRGIMSSICSKNDSATIAAILAEKGIADYFIFPSISWEPKGARLARLVETVQLRAPTIMFIDDNPNNRAEAAAVVPGLQVEDETFIARMLDDPRFRGKNDPELTRLKQYKLLEERKRDEEQASGDNEAFLRSCDIRVYIEYDVEAHIDRAVELINRTNQLNYTKRRLSEDPQVARIHLRDQMKPFDRTSGLVRVADKYGDYGFVGFFMTGNMRQTFEKGAANRHLVHFCFSCRTLGMLIEQWIYEYLGRPELNVVGDVLTDLSTPRDVAWVRLVKSMDSAVDPQHIKIAPHIVLYGGCEANIVGTYLQLYTDKLEVYGNYVSNGTFVSVNYAGRVLDLCSRDQTDIEAELKSLGLPLHLESGNIFADAAAGTLFVFNFSADAHRTARLRHKAHDWTFVLSFAGVCLRAPQDELDRLIASSTSTTDPALSDHFVRLNNHLHEFYEEIGNPELSEIIEDVLDIVLSTPKGCKVIILVDHDQVRRQGAEGLGAEGLVTVDSVSRYRREVEDALSEYHFAAVLSYSDIISDSADILGANHYKREIYLRQAERLAATATRLEPRAQGPDSGRRQMRLSTRRRIEAATRQFSDRYQKEMFDLVQAAFEAILRRPADPASGSYFYEAIASRRMSPADFLRALARTNEYADRWAIADSRRRSQASDKLTIS